MGSNKKYWIGTSVKATKSKPSEAEKKEIERCFNPVIEQFKKEFISKNPNKTYNYLVDIYPKWYQNYYYLCQKYARGELNQPGDGFEDKFVRLMYTGKNKFALS